MRWGILDGQRQIVNLIAVEDAATATALGAVQIVGDYKIGDRYPTIEEQVQQLLEALPAETGGDAGRVAALEEELAAIKAAVNRGAGL